MLTEEQLNEPEETFPLELAFCPDLSVEENLSLGRYPRRLGMLLDREAMTQRAKELLAEELQLTRENVTDDEVLDAMVKHPILINRPLVETDKGVRLCRPQDTVREII